VGEKVICQASSFVADDECGSPRKLVMVEIARVTSLLEANKAEVFFLQLLEHRGERAVRFDLKNIRSVAGDFAIESAGAAADQPRKSATTGRPGDSRKVYVATQRAADDDELTWPIELRRGFVAFVNEFGHGCVNLAAELRSARTALMKRILSNERPVLVFLVFLERVLIDIPNCLKQVLL
jgi:hypothetical protein